MTSMPAIKVIWPCKLNLFLEVLGKRSDGFHDLITTFIPLELGDEIKIQLNSSSELSLDCDGVPFKENLVTHAYNLLKPYAKTETGVHISIQKNVPKGSGLGGGSSNAAATLRLLNRLFQINENEETLKEWALSLGSDVPCLLSPAPYFATGRGEWLTPIDFPELFWLILVPNVHCNTQHFFHQKELKHSCQEPSERASYEREKQSWLETDPLHAASILDNAFEPIVCKEYPSIFQILEGMRELTIPFAVSPRLSGSGSACVMGFFEEKDAKNAKILLQAEMNFSTIDSFVTKNLS